MTEKFDAFKAALHALCVEHGIRLCGGNNYDDYDVYAEWVGDSAAGCELDIVDRIPPTPEEIAAEAERGALDRILRMAREAEYHAAYMARYADILAATDHASLMVAIEADAQEQRKKQMRVSTNPSDPAYIDDRPRRVWVNDREIQDWITADEFRRCVITPDGAINGSVLIERLPVAGEAVSEPAPMVDIGLSGISVALPVEQEPAPAPSFAPAAAVPVQPGKQTRKQRRGR